MHYLTKEALTRLRSEDITITPEDAIILENYAVKTDHISDQKLLEHSGKYCGNVEIFPLTIGARVWLKTEAKEWFEEDVDVYYLSMFYAMAHSRFPDKFIFKSSKVCRKAIHKWAKTINATEDELTKLTNVEKDANTSDINTIINDLLEQIVSNPTYINLVPLINYKKQYIDEIIGVKKDEGCTPIIAWLISNCGESADYWLWKKSWDEIEDLINSTIKQKSGEEAVDMKDPSILAMQRFNRHILQIRKQNGR